MEYRIMPIQPPKGADFRRIEQGSASLPVTRDPWAVFAAQYFPDLTPWLGYIPPEYADRVTGCCKPTAYELFQSGSPRRDAIECRGKWHFVCEPEK